MWEQFGKAEIGFTETQLQQIIESIANQDLTEFYGRYIHGVEELPFNDYLAAVGIELESVNTHNVPSLGMIVKSEHGKEMIKSVASNSPAQLAGVDAGDQLLAIDGFKISADQLTDRLKSYQVGQQIELTIFHGDRLITVPTILAPSQPDRYQLYQLEHPTDVQRHLFQAWVNLWANSDT